MPFYLTDGVISMSVRIQPPAGNRLSRFIRRWRLDRNPLRRGTDRAQTIVLALLVAMFLAGTPTAALAAGDWAHGASRQAQLAQQSSRRHVTVAVLSVIPPPGREAMAAWQVSARWRAPDGQTVTREIPVDAGMMAGGRLLVWTDRTGDVTPAPMSDSQVATQTRLAQGAGAAATAALLALTWMGAAWTLNRRRMAAWEAEWRAVSPWTGPRA